MKRTVKDLMTRTVVTAEPSTPYKELVLAMDENDVGALPVVDEKGALVGIVSEADLLMKEEQPMGRHLLAFGHRRIDLDKASARTARELMTETVVTVKESAPVGEAARMMHSHRVKHLPVVDETGNVTGIITRQDLLRIFLREDTDIRQEVIDDVLLRKLWLTPDEAHVVVSVHEGIVRLEGWVERKSMIEIIDGLVGGVDGVVGVDDRLTFRFDDTHLRPEVPPPWGVLPAGLRRP